MTACPVPPASKTRPPRRIAPTTSSLEQNVCSSLQVDASPAMEATLRAQGMEEKCLQQRCLIWHLKCKMLGSAHPGTEHNIKLPQPAGEDLLLLLNPRTSSTHLLPDCKKLHRCGSLAVVSACRTPCLASAPARAYHVEVPSYIVKRNREHLLHELLRMAVMFFQNM